MGHLRTARARALLKAMLEAREAQDKVFERYQRTLAAAMDAQAGAEGLVAVRREGRAYAQALTQYSNAAMTWLTFVDAQLHPEEATGAE